QSPSALPPPPAQPAKPPAPAPEPEPEPDPTAPTVSLSFSWTQSAAAAVFRRAGWLWIVFDRAQQLDINLLRQLGGSVVQYIEQVPNKHATLVRMITPPGYNATLRKENLLWVIDLSRRSPKPKTVLEVQVLRDFPPGARIVIPVADAGAVLRVGDPEIGDVMHVVPLLALNTGVYPAQSFPELELPATSQGVVAIPRVEGMELLSSRGGVDISHKQAGISASSEQDRRSAQSVDGAEDKGVLDLGSWKRADEEHFDRERASVHSLLSYALPAEKNRVRLEVARFYLAHGYAAEALGILRVIAQEEPDQVETPAFRAARGAAEFLMGRDRQAIEDLSHPSLANEPAAKLWTAAAQAGLSEPGRQAAVLAQSTKYLADYPRPVRFAVAARAAQAAIRGANDIEARRLLDMLGKSAETTYETAQAEWLEGNYYEMTGGFEQAVKHWETAEEGPARPYRAISARSRLELLYKLKKIDAAALIEGLERLRFAWREESFEYPLIERLGQMLINEGRYGEGLRTLKQLATSYSEHKGVAEVTALMAKTFERLYLDGLADSMQPVTAIALFEEFRELTPTGEKGDAMIRRLADRLVAVDLLDRAAELLRHQVWYRLSGVERAKVGARLALVELFGRHPEQALESLKVSDSPDIPPDLAEQRRHLQARALDDLNRPAEALSLLSGDDSRDARLLRAEINWRHQNWAGAGEAFESLVEKPKRDQAVDDGTARIVLHWAIALTLAGDERGVGKVRRQFGPAMAQTPLNDAFSLLTSENESGLIDYRTVAGRIKQAENFQTFLTNYRQRLQTDGLSAIN
ncbi:MAG: tetratricopeptide repeat protein, partial [Alphaproteobacteria bacterium]|nr:tetratricopeptide repeat protein [Alphaproteobacteria bacterium]